MKWKLFLMVTGVIVALIVASCAPLTAVPKIGVPMNIVEAGVVRDELLEDLASWVSNLATDTVLFWYPSTQLFSDRGIGSVASTDKLVFLNNESVGDYTSTTNLQDTKDQIQLWLKPTGDLSGNLKLKLEPDDLLGTTWDLVIGVGTGTKIAPTPDEGYVLVQFIKENNLYKVVSAELKADWKDLTVPKNIPQNQLKGYAFFKIENGEITAALVIEP